MFRALSYILILGGLVIAGLGVHSVWTARDAERQAQQLWEQDLAGRARTPPRIHAVPNGETLARLSIDRLESRWVVFEGAGKDVLRRGPGHLVDTALPGSRGNCVIAGHRDTQFRILRNVEVGEDISLEIGGRTFVYRVTERRVVSPGQGEGASRNWASTNAKWN